MKPYYDDGGVQIYHCDSMEYMIGGPYFDLCLTDPPYGIGESPAAVASRGKLAAATDYGDFSWDTERVSQGRFHTAIRKADQAIVWGGNYYTDWLEQNTKWLVWDKMNGGNDFADCELAWTNLPGAVRIFRHMWNGMLRASENDVPRVHPTQKPIALMKWCLSFAPDAKTVIDPFMGSGSVLVAAKHRGLTAVGIDLEERYCEIAARRLSQGVFDFG